MTGTLAPAQAAAFARDGYLCPLDALTAAEARTVRDRFEAIEAEAGRDVFRTHLRIKGHLVFPWMVELAGHPAILDRVESLVGPDILLFASTMWIKNGRDGTFVSWHQDAPYFKLDPPGQVVAWLAVTDSHPGNGCMRVIPGSHRGPARAHVETRAADNLLTRGQTIEGVDEGEAVDLVLRAGQFSLHHDNIIHGSAPNESDDRRIGVALTYFSTATRSLQGRLSALLVRGEDRHGHWAPDVVARADWDPAAIAHMERCAAIYRGEPVPAA